MQQFRHKLDCKYNGIDISEIWAPSGREYPDKGGPSVDKEGPTHIYFNGVLIV